MIEVKQIYKCSICGNIVEVLYAGGGTLVCCGKPMELLKEKTEDVGQEKHVPVIEKTEKGVKVKVGSVPHPMEENHYIQWIELIVDGISLRKFLKPGDKPEAEFGISGEKLTAREYCNLHGLWKSK
jgi:superoxide reductase